MSALDEMIASLRKLGDAEKVAAAIAAKGARTVKDAIGDAIDAGASPDGKGWAPKKGGGQAYAGASKALESQAYGPLIRITLLPPFAYGHFGAKGRMPPRPMLPDAGSGLPSEVSEALTKAAEEVLAEWTL